jgi:hypothetical protein
MFEWSDDFRCAFLPRKLRRICKAHRKYPRARPIGIVQELVNEISLAFAASKTMPTRNGRGRPVGGPDELLVGLLVPEIFKGHGSEVTGFKEMTARSVSLPSSSRSPSCPLSGTTGNDVTSCPRP